MRRRSASELQFDAGDRVGPYQVVRRVAPSCYDAESVASGAPVRIELASEMDSALIDIRFTRAQAQLSLVDHPLVAQIIDHGVLANGRPWIASERPPGTALSDVISQRRLEPREVTALIYSVAQVLAFAHHRQVVHGSLRPHHLTLSRGAKVSLSGWAWLRTPGIPAFGDPANTSVYNPPEHDGQSPIDGRADVYALGAIAYRALTGVFPDVSRDLLDGNDPLGGAIENMLSLDARDRNSAAAIVADLHVQRLADRAAAKARASSESEAPARASSAGIESELLSRASSPSIAHEAAARASSPSIAHEARARASSPSIAHEAAPRASSPRPVSTTPARGSSTALDPSDLAERLARAEQEIEELRARASSENLRASSESDHPRASNVRAPSENVRIVSSSRTRHPTDDLSRPEGHPSSASRTIEIVSVLTPSPVLLTPVPELESRRTNRMPSPSLEAIDSLATELAVGTIDQGVDQGVDQATEIAPPLEISSRDPITDVEDRLTDRMSVPDATDRFSV